MLSKCPALTPRTRTPAAVEPVQQRLHLLDGALPLTARRFPFTLCAYRIEAQEALQKQLAEPNMLLRKVRCPLGS